MEEDLNGAEREVEDMDILGNLDPEKLFRKVEQKAPVLGNLYGFFGPLAATAGSQGRTENALDAIIRELFALTNPKMPTIEGIIYWWKDWASGTAKNGIVAWLIGEVLGNSRISDFGVNTLKGTALAALVGEIGQGGGAPYGPNPANPDFPFSNPRGPTPTGVNPYDR